MMSGIRLFLFIHGSTGYKGNDFLSVLIKANLSKDKDAKQKNLRHLLCHDSLAAMLFMAAFVFATFVFYVRMSIIKLWSCF